MTTVTQNQAMVAMNSISLDLNDPEQYALLIEALRMRQLVLSKLTSHIVKSHIGQIPARALKKAYGDVTIGQVLSHTEAEVLSRTSAATVAALVAVGMEFSEGCIYCGSSVCVAHTHGESVCG